LGQGQGQGDQGYAVTERKRAMASEPGVNRAAIEALAENRIDDFFDFVAEDATWTVMGSHPFAGTIRGRESIRACQMLPILRGREETERVRVDHCTVTGNMAIVEMCAVAATASGQRLEAAYCWVMRFEAGRVVALRAYVDAGLIWRFMYGEAGW